MAINSLFNVSAIRLKALAFALIAGTFLFFSPAEANAQNTKIEQQVNGKEQSRESIFGGDRPLGESHFTWGADLGATVDLTANDMSTFDLDFILGYKSALFKTLGIGAGIHRTIQSGDNFIPLYALIRTSFTSRPSLLFLNARFGYSFNTIEDSPTFGDYNSSLGCGINLSQSSKAKTYFILGVAYRYFNRRHLDYVARLNTQSVWLAQLQFGVNF